MPHTILGDQFDRSTWIPLGLHLLRQWKAGSQKTRHRTPSIDVDGVGIYDFFIDGKYMSFNMQLLIIWDS